MCDDACKTCGNCKHWAWDQKQYVTRYRAEGVKVVFAAAPCRVDAVEPDAGYYSAVLLADDGNCLNHAQAWEPSADFLAEFVGDTDPRDCVAGIDYPATMPGRRVA